MPFATSLWRTPSKSAKKPSWVGYLPIAQLLNKEIASHQVTAAVPECYVARKDHAIELSPVLELDAGKAGEHEVT